MKTIAKIGISVLFLIVIFHVIPGDEIVRDLRNIHAPTWMRLALLVQIGMSVTQGLSWKILFEPDDSLSVVQATVGQLIVNFAGTLMPGRFSSRLAAPFVFSGIASSTQIARATAVTYVHTILYLIGFGVSATGGFIVLSWMYSTLYTPLLLVPIGLFLGVGGVGFILPFLTRPDEPFSPLPQYCRPEFIVSHPMYQEFVDFLKRNINHIRDEFRRHQSTAAATLLLIASFTIFSGLRMSCLFYAYDVSPRIFELMVIVPTAYSVDILPISFGGIGVAEGSAISLLALMGYDAAAIAPIVFMDRMLMAYLPALFGWGFFGYYDIDYGENSDGTE